MEPLENPELESPSSSQNILEPQLKHILGDTPLNELPLDYIDTVFFGDLYESQKILGAGAFGIVIKVKEKLTKTEYAMKVLLFFLFHIDNINTKSNVRIRNSICI